MAAMLSCHGAQAAEASAPGTRASRASRRYRRDEESEEEAHQEEPPKQEEEAHEEEHPEIEEAHEYDIDAPQPSQATQPTQGLTRSEKGKEKAKTPKGKGRRKKWNNKFQSPEYPHQQLPKGMTRHQSNEDEESSEEEEEDREEEEPSSDEVLANALKKRVRKKWARELLMLSWTCHEFVNFL